MQDDDRLRTHALGKGANLGPLPAQRSGCVVICRQCHQELNQHSTLPIVWCVNPHCVAFDRPQQVQPRQARVIPEEAAPLPALPDATHKDGGG